MGGLPEELRGGIKLSAIFNRIRTDHPSEKLQRNNVEQALIRVGKVQFTHKLQPLIFDYSNGRLSVVDANFLVFMETHSKDELLEYLGFEDAV